MKSSKTKLKTATPKTRPTESPRAAIKVAPAKNPTKSAAPAKGVASSKPAPPKITPTAEPAPTPKLSKVPFLFEAPEAQEVFLAGTFNGWEPNATPLKRQKNGRWSVELPLDQGTYEYLFVVDGQWTFDPTATDQMPNPFGTCNALLKVA